MSPWQRKLRRAIGSVKDHTTIGLAKVAGAMAPELEVALVKATGHDKSPVEEKHVQEVIFLTSTSRAYTMACVTHLSRRLSRTQNWIVAVKTLMLIHRLLKEGGHAFQDELFRESRAGGQILNLSGFQDDSASCGWEFSAFVRTYALYLDELLDYNASNCAHSLSTDSGRLSSSSNSSYGRRSGSDAYGSVTEEHALGWQTVAFKDMKPEELLERMPPVQRMLERVLACHPAGDARMDRLILNALDCIVRDSFQFYDNVRDGLAVLLDAFFDLEDENCTRAFEIHTIAAKQAEALIAFYGSCKSSLHCCSSDYPFVQKIPEALLETMEGFLRDLMVKRSNEKQERGSKELKALPAPPPVSVVDSAPMQIVDVQQQSIPLSFLGMHSDSRANKDQDRSLVMPQFAPIHSSAWQDFDNGEMLPVPEVLQVPRREIEEEKTLSGWELALAAPPSSQTPRPFNSFVTGRESDLFIGRLQEQASYHQRLPLSLPLGQMGSLAIPDNSPSLLASPDMGSLASPDNSSSLLALPAPNTPPEEDPFVASSSIPPPPYVQMSDMQQKQALLMQEQMLWDRYRREGMHGRNGLAKSYNTQLDDVFHPFPFIPFLQ